MTEAIKKIKKSKTLIFTYGISLLCIIYFIISFISGITNATSGGLNAQGCHNSKTAGYHCHRNAEGSLSEHSTTSQQTIPHYDRKDYSYQTVKFSPNRPGYYTGIIHCTKEADHIVALEDAHISGAWKWSLEQKRSFANERSHLVPACDNVNSSKGSLPPVKFYARSTDNRGVEVAWTQERLCRYLAAYYTIKTLYRLSFHNNDPEFFFSKCSIVIPKAIIP